MSNNQENEGGLPQNQSQGQDTYSTTGDGHPPRPGEQGHGSSGGSQQSSGGGSNAGQQQTGGTGGYGGTSGESGAGS